MAREPTPPQTVGPFFHGSLLREPRTRLAPDGVAGERIRIEGRVLDGEGRPVTDALVEVWQAEVAARDADRAGDDGGSGGSAGFGRSGTDGVGRYGFESVRPVRSPAPDGSSEAPHLDVLVFARGLLDRLATRIYFEDDDPVAIDPFLRAVPEERRATLIATRDEEGRYLHDLVLQGASETVFFDA
ncbi:MAG TPA: protocatechuate 3,4-dioxygenase subunit alpha [Actinomycetota bacterium]|nr:protocatechuate 3,4-dioxygenase subunit alpha [Actinomycetota bacterium]